MSEGERKIKVDVEVDSKTLKKALQRQNQLESELEAERAIREDAEAKLKLAAQKLFADKKARLGCDDPNIKTPSQLKQWAEENVTNSSYGEPPVGRGSAGSLKLSSAQLGEDVNQGFDSYEQMIETLTDKKLTGTPQEREEAKAILDEFWKKLDKGIQSGQIPRGKIFEDTECKERGESILFRILRKNNERLRKKAFERREK